MSVPCFWVDLADEVELVLRRTSSGAPVCPSGYHEGVSELGRIPARRDAEGDYESLDPRDAEWVDQEWPRSCSWGCGYEFVDGDSRQVNQERIWRARDGREWLDHKLPPGALLDGWWHTQKAADGLALVVVLPPPTEDSRGRWWHVDGPSRSNGVPGPGWERTGDPRSDPPTVAATPSILTSDYHGFLVVEDGRSVLREC